MGKQSKIYKFFNSYLSICIALSIICTGLIIYHFYFKNTINTYVFSGYNEDFKIMEGTIYTSYDINRFSAPSILYTGDKLTLKEYTIGYYIGDEEISLVVNSEDNAQYDLDKILHSAEFSFTETHKDAKFFSKSHIKNIDKLVFKINGTDTKDKSISIEIPLEVTKISK